MSDPKSTEPAPSESRKDEIQEAWLTSSTPSLVALASGGTHALLATNAAFEAFFGWKWGDPRTLLDLFRFEEGKDLSRLTDEVLRTSRPSSVNGIAVRLADPTSIYSARVLMDFTCFPMSLSDGKTPAVLVHARLSHPVGAISIPLEPDHPPSALTQVPSMDQDRLALALEAVKMGVWEWNPISGVSMWNPQMYGLVGLPSESVEPTVAVFLNSVHPSDREAMNRRLAESVAGKAEFAMEFRVIRADNGEERWLASRGRARFGADGKAVVLHGVSFDITERVRNEHRLRSINQRRAEFLAVLGHELRNPLASLLYLSTTMEASKTSTAESLQAAQLIKRQVLQLTHLVDDLLEVSRIEQGKIELRKQALAVDAVVASAVETVLPVIKQRQQVLELHIAPGLMLDADSVRLTQVLSNLLNNASKFTQEGGRIEVEVTGDAETVHAIVRDNGPGIEPGVMDTMFEPFTQGQITLDRAQGGLGIGLSIVKRIVEMHGGTVTVATSQLGSAFTISMPRLLAPSATELPAPAAAGLIDQRGRDDFKPMKFLVVEDNLDVARMMAEFVRMVGHPVFLAHDGEEGVRMALEHRPDVILMDVGLPKLDGWAACERLRADDRFKETVMIAMSGYCQPRDQERSLQAGFDLHMSKPADLAEVFRFLETHPRLRRQHLLRREALE